MNLRQAAALGGRAALAAFGLPDQPSPASVGIDVPKTPGFPRSTTATPRRAGPAAMTPKTAFNVGMGASQSSNGAGAGRGDPPDEGRHQRSIIDRAFQRNEDDYATSSTPAPGAAVSP